MIVVDASVVVHALANDDADGAAARERLEHANGLAAPQLVDLEVVSALRALVFRGKVGRRRAEQALADLGMLDLDRWDHGGLIRRVWQLRDSLSTYDASYLALAERLGCALVTADARLAKGAEHAKCAVPIEVLTTG